MADCEFVSAFAGPLAALVMCELLGVPPEDYDRFHSWATEIGLAFSRVDLPGELLARVDAAVSAMTEYVDGLIARRRDDPADDLITYMIAAEESGDSLSNDELHNLAVLLVWAGQDTTSLQLGRAMVTFAEHPGQWGLLAGRPDLLTQAVEEVCRWSPQARATNRFARMDLEYNGLPIQAGTQLLCCNAPANRDPRAFEAADRFDVAVRRKSRQLVFGGGVYYCLGVALARLELAEAFRALTRRFGPPTITGPIGWRPAAAMIHGPDALPLRFAPKDL